MGRNGRIAPAPDGAAGWRIWSYRRIGRYAATWGSEIMTLPVDANKTTLSGPGTDKTQEVDALLTRANLLRIRGNMREAIDCCMAAMRIVPGSVPAQSLLGDIYES